MPFSEENQLYEELIELENFKCEINFGSCTISMKRYSSNALFFCEISFPPKELTIF